MEFYWNTKINGGFQKGLFPDYFPVHFPNWGLNPEFDSV
jgi:hypothetical protein